MKRVLALSVAILLLCGTAIRPADEPVKKDESAKADDLSKEIEAAREKGLDWLTKNQAKDGSWGKTYTMAVTSFACLAFLSASDEPFTGDRGKALVKGLEFLMSSQKDGTFPKQFTSWIHGQGFATLALSEAYGRALFAKTEPDMDMKKVKAVVEKAVDVIQKGQSASGGWWYTTTATAGKARPPLKGQDHEGSTTVCAVQAIVSASNYGIAIDQKVLDKGFDYLKKCQTKEGGFNYKLGDGKNMKEGTAAGMSTLGLMNKFDNDVMMKAYKFLLEVKPKGITAERYPYYGHFYATMAMHLANQEFGDAKEFREKTAGYIAETQKEVVAWQGKEGNFAHREKNMTKRENDGYPTAYGTLILLVPEGRLSIYKRVQPELPKK